MKFSPKNVESFGMDFKKSKIGTSKPPRDFSLFSLKNKVLFSLVIGIVIVIFLLTGIVKALGKIDVSSVLKIAGADLRTDENGNTNFLLLGSGGEGHDGGDLTDTIIVASYNHKSQLATMMSIPRDLFVKDKEVGSSRINEVFFNGNLYYDDPAKALEHFMEKVEEILGEDIHYYAKVDFKGFKELIDAIGGVDVYVNESIYDPFYPKAETVLYETFSLQKGLQHLDGDTALKYARSRKTTSDYDRSDRQQKILYAIKDQVLKSNLIFDQDKIQEILDTLKANVKTNISVKEILTLGAIAKNISQDKLVHRLLHDDPTRCGGFLYPPDRSLYGGAFVLIPAGGWDFLHLYTNLNFNYPEIARENTRIQVLNGTRGGGIAGSTKQILQRYCFDINRFGNGRSKEITETTYFYKQKFDENGKEIESRPKALDFLQKLIPGKESMNIPTDYSEYMEGTDLLLEIGSDYTNSPQYIRDPFLSLPALPVQPATTEPATEATTEPATQNINENQ